MGKKHNKKPKKSAAPAKTSEVTSGKSKDEENKQEKIDGSTFEMRDDEPTHTQQEGIPDQVVNDDLSEESKNQPGTGESGDSLPGQGGAGI